MEQRNRFGPEPIRLTRRYMEQHNRFGRIRLTQVMYCGMAQAAQKALLATFFCTKVYIAVENDGSQTFQTPYAPSHP